MFEPKTIEEQIDCLAKLTGAPESFVLQVRELFSKKGIPLDSDASPYLRALEEAFKREENIRANARRARRSISKLADNFDKIGKSYVRQLEHLKRIQSSLQEQELRAAPKKPSRKSSRRRAAGTDLQRPFVIRQENDHLPMVPGPEEDQ
jgi:hypothetical protein